MMTNCNFTASHCPGIKHFSLLLTYVLKSQKMTSSSLILLSWLLLVGCVACYRGYSPLYSRTLRCGVASRHVMRSPRSVLWVAKDNDSEQTITDLNLEEMFDVFEAADKKIKTSDLKPAKLTMNDNPTVDGNAVAAGSDENKGINLLTYGIVGYIVYLGVDTVRILVTAAANGPVPSA